MQYLPDSLTTRGGGDDGRRCGGGVLVRGGRDVMTVDDPIREGQMMIDHLRVRLDDG